MSLDQKLSNFFEKSIYLIICLLVFTWMFVCSVVFKSYVRESENFLATLIDSHNDELLSGNWREFLEGTKRNNSKYLYEIKICWVGSVECENLDVFPETGFVERIIHLTVPLDAQAPVIKVSAAVKLKAPIKDFLILSFAFSLIILIVFILKSLTKRNINKITISIRNLACSVGNNATVIDDFPEELRPLASAFYSAAESLRDAHKEAVSSRAFADLAAQVSHDIRSPLAALEMLSFSLAELQEDRRVVLRNSINRIRDIANNLLVVYRNALNTNQTVNVESQALHTISIEFIATLIESVVTEKRLQYRNRLNTEIDFVLQKESYGIFLKTNGAKFKVVLSNLIDNAVESFTDCRGKIHIHLRDEKIGDSDMLSLSIEDNGKGVPAEILPSLGRKGITFGKANGNGLGLNSAITCIKDWDGQLHLDSKLGEGTRVRLLFPKAEPPSWFLKCLLLRPGSKVVILDDDQSIHSIWRGRLSSIMANDHGISSINISTPNEIRQYFGKNFDTLEDTIFLVDYELAGFDEKGIDLISELGIQSQSILVTSRFEEPIIREACMQMGVKMVPKLMTTYLPIVITHV